MKFLIKEGWNTLLDSEPSSTRGAQSRSKATDLIICSALCMDSLGVVCSRQESMINRTCGLQPIPTINAACTLVPELYKMWIRHMRTKGTASVPGTKYAGYLDDARLRENTRTDRQTIPNWDGGARTLGLGLLVSKQFSAPVHAGLEVPRVWDVEINSFSTASNL